MARYVSTTASGIKIIDTAGTFITQANTGTATTFYNEPMPVASMQPGRLRSIENDFTLTTPVVGIPGLTVNITIGSTTFQLFNSAGLIGGNTGRLLSLKSRLCVKDATTIYYQCNVVQPMQLLNLSNSNSNLAQTFSGLDLSQPLNFIVTAVFTGVSLGAANLTNTLNYTIDN